jgi:hypothetical protein
VRRASIAVLATCHLVSKARYKGDTAVPPQALGSPAAEWICFSVEGPAKLEQLPALL